MKYGHTVKKNGILYPAGAEIPEDIPEEIKPTDDVPEKVEPTDDVPEGALETKPDGSVNAYDEAENKVGIVDAKTAKQAQEEAGKAFEEQNAESAEPEKPKRGRKLKEA